MSQIVPFRAIRPAAGKVLEVVSHPVEAYTKSAIQSILTTNPDSFLQIVFAFRTSKKPNELPLDAIKRKFGEFRTEGKLVEDEAPAIYLYRQQKDSKSHLGIIALASVADYDNGRIKVHEQTLIKKVEKLKDYLAVADFNAEPVSIVYSENEKLDGYLREIALRPALYDFTSGTARHQLWKIGSKEEISKISNYFGGIPSLYIADGHHRVASSVLLAHELRANNKSHTGSEPYNFFMAAFFGEKEISILNYNRMCDTLSDHAPASFLEDLAGYFDISEHGEKIVKPSSANEIAMYLEHKWYLLKTKSGVVNSKNPVDLLDVSLLSDKVFSSILHITDLRNDKRVSFVPGTAGVKVMEEAVDSGRMKVAFCLHPISFGELKAVADSGGIMPPKSTWIEPKLENGLLIYSMGN